MVLLTHYSRDNSKIESNVKKSLTTLWERSKILSGELRCVELGEKSDRLLLVKKQFVQICCIFNLLSKFIKEWIELSKLQ
jgi:hypothetical protein